MTHPLHSFFWPESIAVLGASPDLHRIRGRLLHQLRENGFPGRVLPINPSYQEIAGLPCYRSIAAVGTPVDLALVAIPAAGVAAALEECAQAGVKNALIISSGFAEEGGAAGDMQADLVEVTKRTGIRACGPNCEGYFNALGKVATTFSPTVEMQEDENAVRVSDRRIGVIAQSGGIGFALFNRGKAAGIGFSYVISTGNEADLSMADFLDYMVAGPQHPCRDAVLRGGAQRPQFRRRAGEGAAAWQADYCDQGGTFQCRHPRIRVAYRIAVWFLHRLSRDLRTLRCDRSRGHRRSRRHRRRSGKLPAAERPSRRHRYAFRRRRRLDGGYAVGLWPDRAAAVSRDPGRAASADAVLWRVGQSGRCHGPRVSDRSRDDDRHGATRAKATRSTWWC